MFARHDQQTQIEQNLMQTQRENRLPREQHQQQRMWIKSTTRRQPTTMRLLQTIGLILVGLVQSSFGQHSLDSTSIMETASTANMTHKTKLLDKCCQIGRVRAAESVKLDCKLSAFDAFHEHQKPAASFAVSQLGRDPNLVEQCELILESCCIGFHRTKNCDSGKQFAKSGAMCMDVELSKDVTVAAESFNDCCMSCSLGILAARNPPGQSADQNQHQHHPVHNNLDARCKLISPLASSLSGQLYEHTYTECCLENLPKPSSALLEPGAPTDCTQANSCSQRCISAGSLDPVSFERVDRDKCACFAGYTLAPDGLNCLDIDECKSGTHTCNKFNEVCDNTRGSFRCLARRTHLNQGFVFDGSADAAVNKLFSEGQIVNTRAPLSNVRSSNLRSAPKTDFISLRLCPLGTRWSNENNQCSPEDGSS